MISKSYTSLTLEPAEGYLLTQANDIDIKERIFSSLIVLSINDSEDNWKEIPIDEAKKLQVQQRELRRKEKEMKITQEQSTLIE